MVDKTTLDGLRIHRPDEAKRGAVPRIITAVVLLVVLAGIAFAMRRATVKEVRVGAAKAITGTSGGSVPNASGDVTARRQATVSSKVTGKIVDVYTEEAMRVKAGQELARLDSVTA